MPLYEIHISVELKDGNEELNWIFYCKEHRLHSIRVMNEQGKHSIQNMIAKWCDRETDDDAIHYAQKIAADMEDADFRVVRTKVEAMMFGENACNLKLPGKSDQYWEFHMKIEGVDTSRKLQDLSKLLYQRAGVGLSYSDRGSSQCPIITLRVHHGTRTEAIQRKDLLILDIKRLGFHIHDKIQAELAVFDNNPELDVGWIHNSEF